MTELLCRLVMSLSMDSGNFSRNTHTIDHKVKETDSVFHPARVGGENYEKTVEGTETHTVEGCKAILAGA